MPVIKQDKYGIFLNAGGYVCRPVIESRYKPGDKVPAHHFSQSTRIGVGKEDSSKPREYVENWMATRMTNQQVDDEEGLINHRRCEMLSTWGRLYDYLKPTLEEKNRDLDYLEKLYGRKFPERDKHFTMEDVKKAKAKIKANGKG